MDSGNMRRHREVVELLLQKGLINEDMLEQARAENKRIGVSIEDALEKLGFTSAEEIVKVRADSLGLPHMDLSDYIVDRQIIKLLPENMARKFMAIPLFKIGNSLTVGMVDPQDIDVVVLGPGDLFHLRIAGNQHRLPALTAVPGHPNHARIPHSPVHRGHHPTRIVRVERHGRGAAVDMGGNVRIGFDDLLGRYGAAARYRCPPVCIITVMPTSLAHATMGAASSGCLTLPRPISPTTRTPSRAISSKSALVRPFSRIKAPPSTLAPPGLKLAQALAARIARALVPAGSFGLPFR